MDNISVMTKVSINFFFCIIAFTSCRMAETNPDWSKISLCGPVKSVCETSYSPELQFGDYVKSDYNQLEMNIGFPCNSRTVFFDKRGKISRIVSSYGDDLIQEPIYDSSHNLVGEFMTLNGKLLYSRQYDKNDISQSINKYPRREFIESFHYYDDLYSEAILPRTYIEVDRFDNTRMNFCDTVVIIREYDHFLKSYDIEEVRFYNDRCNHFLNGNLSLYSNHYFSYTYDDHGRIKFRNLNSGGKERFEYDSENKVDKVLVYDKDGDCIISTQYSYNVNKLLSEEKTTYWLDHDSKEASYHYDEHNRLVQYYDKTYRDDNTYSNNVLFTYDYTGNLTSIKDDRDNYEISRNEKGLIDTIKKSSCSWMSSSNSQFYYSYYSYDDLSIRNIHETDLSIYTKVETEYDSHGNWISKLCYLGDQAHICYERTIEYY